MPILTTWAVSTNVSKLRKEITGVSGKLCFFMHPLKTARIAPIKKR
jgi:hypothetical protein